MCCERSRARESETRIRDIDTGYPGQNVRKGYFCITVSIVVVYWMMKKAGKDL